MNTTQIEQAFEVMIQAMVPPDAVSISTYHGDFTTVVQVEALSEAARAALHPQGPNVEALQRLLHAISSTQKTRYALAISEPCPQIEAAATDGWGDDDDEDDYEEMPTLRLAIG